MTRLVRTVLSFGETLWDLLPDGAVLGGAPCNLAYRVNAFGERGRIVTRLGRDERGRTAFDRIRGLGMETGLIQWDERKPTGTVPVTVDAKGVPDFTIVEDVAYDHIEATPGLLAEAAAADCVCFGTLVQRTAGSREALRRVLAAAPRALKVLDLNLRRRCYTRETVEHSLQAADILKLNDGEAMELARTFGLKGGTPEEAARECRSRWDLDACVVTLGERGAYGVTARGEAAVGGRKVEVADTIGSGDAFTAAFVTGWLRGRSLEDCVTVGNALGAMVARTKGATAPISADEINRFCGRTI
jgi:fructokinase